MRPVIIKCYIKAKMKPKNFTRMEREIRLMKFLSQSEMMCQFYGSFESENHKYIIMEHCRGGDLFKFMLMRGGNLPEPWVAAQVREQPCDSCSSRKAGCCPCGRAAEAEPGCAWRLPNCTGGTPAAQAHGRWQLTSLLCTQIIIPLLRSLVLLHTHNIIHRCALPCFCYSRGAASRPTVLSCASVPFHELLLSSLRGGRDIKPENIFLTGSHRFKMGDLGLAICIGEELPFTRSGTLDYMAPEARPALVLQEVWCMAGDMEAAVS